ncbi:protein Wnt-5a [Trichonephila clavipes]|nr:protein Wnt-5a [Trichonephila clavipes]
MLLYSKAVGLVLNREALYKKSFEKTSGTLKAPAQQNVYTRQGHLRDSSNRPKTRLPLQQDGATCHTARATIDLLKDTFGDHLISRFGPVNWPPRSCDLTPLDYFLWGYIKSLVYADKPQTLDHLEDNIRRVIADIRSQMLEKVIENWTSRLDYIRASPGVAYSVTRACSKGELGECRCDELVRKRDNGGRWKWGGCSDDIKFGARFSKDFVDSGEDQRTPEGLMNIHNNEAGRRGLRSKMELVCKCHGVSGSCSMRVCWRRLKPFREIGELLTSKFDGATLVKAVERRHKVKLRPVRKNVKRPSKKDLVFLDDSPDYCVRNETTGVLGTRGRLCNSTSYGMDGCRLLCCGRGYQTVIREVEEKCQCKFVWCCRVHCEMCSFKKEEHYCN